MAAQTRALCDRHDVACRGAGEAEKKISQPRADANREIKFDYGGGMREGESLESFVRENRENEIARERNLILCRARVTFISACRSREYRRRRINSPVERRRCFIRR